VVYYYYIMKKISCFLITLIALAFINCEDPTGFSNGKEQGGAVLNNDSWAVVFKLNDGTNKTHDIRTVAAPAATIATLPGDPSRIGHVFAGWNTRDDGEGLVFTTKTTISANLTVYAKWVEVPPDSYTVIFDLNYGTAARWDAKVVTRPATIIGADDWPDDPTRTGYDFAGWNTVAEDGTVEIFTASTMVSGDITVYARWTQKTYTVTFYLNHGGNAVHDIRTVTFPTTTLGLAAFPAKPVHPASVPGHPDYPGYAFVQWNSRVDGTGYEFTADTPISGDINVYAKWKELGGSGITLILDEGEGALEGIGFTISRSGVLHSRIKNVRISPDFGTMGVNYTNPRWLVDGKQLDVGVVDNITIDANAVDYTEGGYPLALGGHFLTLIITKSGAPWSKEIVFTVAVD
jgi:uncharacterized repeat protein (TIGR02543 family)